VPQRAATRSPEGDLSVWVVDDENKAQPRQIQVDQAYEDSWVVTSGLSAGERVIVLGYQKVSEDAEVNPEPWEGARKRPEEADFSAAIAPAASAENNQE
jgi:multidrug efflux pump subunit AcrA (membrane-fusion protein)